MASGHHAGAHRSLRLLYERAFGSSTLLGNIADEDRNYDPSHSWKISQGVCSEVDEMGLIICWSWIFS
jgi:hypothetical protein